MSQTDDFCMAKFWDHLRALHKVIHRTRFSFFSLVIGVLFLLVVGQGQEVILEIVENKVLANLMILPAAWFWALSMWYWARQLLGKGDNFWETHVPRWYGILGLAGLTVAFLKAVGENQSIFGSIFAVSTIVFAVFVYKRRDMLEETILWRSSTTKILLNSSILITAIFLVLFTVHATNQMIAPTLGSGFILLLAATSWVVFGSYLLHLSKSEGIPYLTLLAVLVVIFSKSNDNHQIHTLPVDRTPPEPTLAESVDAHFKEWAKDKGDKEKVYLVATEGGGIRAAYWTVTVLEKLQKDDPKFANNLYAISGVSGGSLGAAVFDAMLAHGVAGKDGKALEGKCNFVNQATNCSQSMLSHDFLSPTLSSMLFPDLTQKFLPFAINYLDRGRQLELSWEKAWKKVMGDSEDNIQKVGFQYAFDNLWQGDRKYKIPSLILNSTSVGVGRRVIMSNLPLNRKGEFNDVASLRGWLGDKQMPLSTAAHNSARFTFVSPAGSISDQDETLHIVDGGYFENSATTAISELLTIIKGSGKKVNPVVIHISNDAPLEKIYTSCHITQKSELHFGRLEKEREYILPELLSPVLALVNAREAHGVESTEALAQAVINDEGDFYHFGLNYMDKDTKQEVPLGWSLSKSAEAFMIKQSEKVSLTNCKK